MPMFPPALSHRLASLVAGELRPTLSFVVELGLDGTVQATRLTRGQVRVARRLDYDGVNAILVGNDDPLAGPLQQLYTATRARKKARVAQGALAVSQPELKITVQAGQVSVQRLMPDVDPARQLVSETMILANSLAAQYAAAHELPVLYRAQDPPDDEYLVGLELDYDPVVMRTLFRGMRPSRFTEHVTPHAGLGLAAYTQVSSPIRRYADLALQRQLVAHLAGEVYPYTQTELMPVLATAEVAERASRNVERRAKQFWSLTYLEQQHLETPLDAVVIHRVGGGYEVELLDTSIRGFLRTSDRFDLGDKVTVRIDRLEPRRGRVRFVEVA